MNQISALSKRVEYDGTQDQLAINANISRATVADFETSTRQPMKNNLKSIVDCMFASGIEFIPEEGGMGVGVRFREQKLEYIKDARIDLFNRRAVIRMRFGGVDFICYVDLNVIDDYHRTNRRQTEEEYVRAISKMLHIILAAVERHAGTHIRNGELILTFEMLEST